MGDRPVRSLLCSARVLCSHLAVHGGTGGAVRQAAAHGAVATVTTGV